MYFSTFSLIISFWYAINQNTKAGMVKSWYGTAFFKPLSKHIWFILPCERSSFVLERSLNYYWFFAFQWGTHLKNSYSRMPDDVLYLGLTWSSSQAKELESYNKFTATVSYPHRPTPRPHVIAGITTAQQNHSHLPCDCLNIHSQPML